SPAMFATVLEVQGDVERPVVGPEARRGVADVALDPDDVGALADALDPLVRMGGSGAVLAVDGLEAGAVGVHRDAVDERAYVAEVRRVGDLAGRLGGQHDLDAAALA